MAVALIAASCASFEATPQQQPVPADAAGGDAAGGDGDGSAPPAYKLAWVSGGSGAPIGDVKDADQKCRNELQTTRPGGDAIGWVVSEGVSPVQRLGSASGPWKTASGTLVFASRDALLASRLENGLTESLYGTLVAGRVWTGLLPDGGPSGLDCNGWTDIVADAGATVGLLGATDGAWVAIAAHEPCASNRPHYLCLER